MSIRLKRALVLASLGGMVLTIGPFAWGCQPFAQNQPYISFLAGIGNDAVAVGVDNFLTSLNNQDLYDWFNVPLTNLYQDIWSGWVGHQLPTDPTYGALLVE